MASGWWLVKIGLATPPLKTVDWLVGWLVGLLDDDQPTSQPSN